VVAAPVGAGKPVRCMSRLSLLLEFLQEDPHDPFTRFAVAQEYRKLGQLNEAIDAFTALQRDDPAYVGLYYHFGHTLMEAQRKEDALAWFREGIVQARAVRDPHALAELQDALNKAEMGWDDED